MSRSRQGRRLHHQVWPLCSTRPLEPGFGSNLMGLQQILYVIYIHLTCLTLHLPI